MRIRAPWFFSSGRHHQRFQLAVARASSSGRPRTGTAACGRKHAASRHPDNSSKELRSNGNRRLRDEDILYYVQTRPGDVYKPEQVERDLQAILDLRQFLRQSRIPTSAPKTGRSGGVIVIFNVKELPIIRDIQFEGHEERYRGRRAQGFPRAARRHLEGRRVRPRQGQRLEARHQGTARRARQTQRDHRRARRTKFR